MSELRANTISDAAGTGPVTLTGQFASRAFCRYDQASVAIDESGNISSVTDVTTGRKTLNFSNSFAAATYAPVSYVINRTGTAFCNEYNNTVVSAPTSSSFSSVTSTTTTSFDSESGHLITGDLA